MLSGTVGEGGKVPLYQDGGFGEVVVFRAMKLREGNGSVSDRCKLKKSRRTTRWQQLVAKTATSAGVYEISGSPTGTAEA